MDPPLIAGFVLLMAGGGCMAAGAILVSLKNTLSGTSYPTVLVILGIALLYAGSRWVSIGRALRRA